MWEAGTGCVLHPARTTLGFPPALSQSGTDRAGDNGLDVVLPPKNTCQQFEMHKVHGNASSWDVMNCAKPQCFQNLLSVFHRIPDSQQSCQFISLPSHLFYVFLPTGALAHQTSFCSVFPGAVSAPCCSQRTRWSGCLHTQGVKSLNGFCRTWLLRKARANSAPWFPLIPVTIFMVL